MANIDADVELTASANAMPVSIALGDSLHTDGSIATHISEGNEQTPLPPTDRGKAAWLVLAGCSLIQAPVWGTQCTDEAVSQPSILIPFRVFSVVRGLPRVLYDPQRSRRQQI